MKTDHGDYTSECFSPSDIDGSTCSYKRPNEVPRSNGVRFVMFDEFTDVQKIWLLLKMLGEGDFAVLYGEPGCGKSVLAGDIGLHVAAGMIWHGRSVRQGAVVYIALERSQLVKRRARAFGIKHNVAGLPFAVIDGVVNLRRSRAVNQIIETIREIEHATKQKVVLIVIDTINRAMCGGDENSSKDMGELIAAVARIQSEVHSAVLGVHHLPHDGDRMRGHGSLLGAVDVTIKVEKGMAYRTATVVKANDAHEGEQVAFTLETVDLASGAQAPVVVPIDLGSRPSASFSAMKKLNPNQRRFVDIVRTAIAELPADNNAPGVPNHVQAITRDNLKRFLVSMGWTEEAESNNARAKISNMLNALAGKHVIGTTTQFVWLTS